MENITAELVRTTCPVCGTSTHEAKEFFFRDWRGYEALTPFAFYHVYGCPTCGMVYAGDMQVSMSLAQYYTKMSRYEGKNYTQSQEAKASYQRTAEHIVEVVGKNVSVLDIGCSYGGLLNALKECGVQHLHGLEPSAKNVQFAREHFGLSVTCGGLGLGNSLQERFQTVILSTVLEHFEMLHENIDEIKSYLTPKGKVIIIVPDMDGFATHENLYQDFSIEHINFFSIRALQELFAKHGMRLVTSSFLLECGIPEEAPLSFTVWEEGEASLPKTTPDFSNLETYIHNCEQVVNKECEKILTLNKYGGGVSLGCWNAYRYVA